MHKKYPNYGLQTTPARRWKTVKKLKQNENGFNGGINVVEDCDEPGKTYIEKVSTRESVKNGIVEQEIMILKHLSNPPHPHITMMVDHFVDKKLDEAGIYLEHCTEEGLETFIRKRRQTGRLFNEIDIWQVFIQLFDGLAYCHFGPENERQNTTKTDWNVVWHRDIKPANILVTKSTLPAYDLAYTFKLGDFGCSVDRKSVWADKLKKRKKGSFETKGWQSPEAPTYVARSDVWQLGAIIGCLCTLTEVAHQLDYNWPAPGYSKVLNEAIKSCMIKNVKRRPSSVEVLQFVKKRYNEMRPTLVHNPRPDPAVLKAKSQPPSKFGNQKHARMPRPPPSQNLRRPRGYSDPEFRHMPGRRGMGPRGSLGSRGYRELGHGSADYDDCGAPYDHPDWQYGDVW